MRKFTLGLSIVFIAILSFTKTHAQVPGGTCTDPISVIVNLDCSSETAVTYPMDFSVAPPQGSISCHEGTAFGYWLQLTVTETSSLRINNNYNVDPIGLYVLAADCSGPELECTTLENEYDVINIDPGVYYALFWRPVPSGTTEICFESVSCMEPQYISTDYVDYDSANIYWDAPTSANEVEWEVTEDGFPSIIVDSGTTSSDNTEVINLIDDTLYHFKIRSSCTGSVYSDWADYAFSTPNNPCEEPYNLSILEVTNTEVTFSWEFLAGATTWDYDVRPAGDAAPSGTDLGNPTLSNPMTDEGLEPETSYDVYVRTNCDPDFSAWIGPMTFTTLSDEAADWNNLQWPTHGTIDINQAFTVFAQVYEPGITDADNTAPGVGVSAWIGYSTENTDPSTWTNWQQATYNVDDVNHDEFMADIGTGIGVQGTYYYASRFKINNGYYTYGGLNGFWYEDSGVLTVENFLGVDNQVIKGFMMYPNPTKSNLTISAKNRIESVVIVNMLGQEILTNNTNSTDLQLDISKLPFGNYILKVQVGNQLGTYHFIKE